MRLLNLCLLITSILSDGAPDLKWLGLGSVSWRTCTQSVSSFSSEKTEDCAWEASLSPRLQRRRLSAPPRKSNQIIELEALTAAKMIPTHRPHVAWRCCESRWLMLCRRWRMFWARPHPKEHFDAEKDDNFSLLRMTCLSGFKPTICIDCHGSEGSFHNWIALLSAQLPLVSKYSNTDVKMTQERAARDSIVDRK